MKKNLDQHFRIGIVGFGLNNSHDFSELILGFIHQLRLMITSFNNTRNGYTGKDTTIDFFTSPLVADDIWMNIVSKENATLSVAVANTENIEKSSLLVSNAQNITDFCLESGIISVYKDVINWICNQSDLVLLLWDGKSNTQQGNLKEFISSANKNGIKCLRIDPKTGLIYEVDTFGEIIFSVDSIKNYITELYELNQNSKIINNSFFLSRLWGRFYKHFRRKYDKSINFIPDPKDLLLEETYFDNQSDKVKQENHKVLVQAYKLFDEQACVFSTNYRNSIYFRSIMPFIATVFLAIGFYIETFGKYLIRPNTGPGLIPGLAEYLAIIAGIGFLIHAGINLYGFRMSKSSFVQGNLHEFVNNRYCAEYLRNAIYCMSFGVPLCQNVLLPLYTVKLDSITISQVKRLLRSLKPTSHSFTQQNCMEMLDNLSQMMDDQIIYHQNTQKRYAAITRKLEKAATVVFVIGFIIVITRGIFQFSVPFFHAEWFVKSLYNGKSLKDFLQSFANMLALMLPSWASYFSTKLSLNNFKVLQEHSATVEQKLNEIENKIHKMKFSSNISYESLYALSDEVLTFQLSELTSWYTQTASKTVTKM